MKRCPGCHVEYTDEEYGKHYYCIMCRRGHQLRRTRQGMTYEDYMVMFKAQDGRCKICGREPQGRGALNGKRRLDIDHDHKTGRVRGLICRQCNAGMGCFQDDVQLLKKVVAYMEA